MSKRFRTVIYNIFALGLIFNTVYFFLQPSMVFFPLKEINMTPKTWGLPYEDIRIELANKDKISAWYLPHSEASKTVLFFHGNGGNMSHRGESLAIFHKLKLNVLIIDYAGYGQSEGTPSEGNLYESAFAAWNYLLEKKKIEPEKIFIFGRSLGGAVAVDLATKVKAAGLILESSFSSARDVANNIFPVVSHFLYLRYSFDSKDKIAKVNYPVLMIHSPDDEIIPFELGVKLFNAVTAKKEFLQIKGGHNDGFMKSLQPYMQRLNAFSQSN